MLFLFFSYLILLICYQYHFFVLYHSCKTGSYTNEYEKCYSFHDADISFNIMHMKSLQAFNLNRTQRKRQQCNNLINQQRVALNGIIATTYNYRSNSVKQNKTNKQAKRTDTHSGNLTKIIIPKPSKHIKITMLYLPSTKIQHTTALVKSN